MRLATPSLFSLILLLSPLSASAHDSIPKDWCDDPELIPVVVDEFQFDEIELIERARRFEATHDHSVKPNSPGQQEGKCGIVDLWSWSDLLAHEHCAEKVPEARAMPLVFGPTSFLETDHHERYGFRDGLNGACVVCKEH